MYRNRTVLSISAGILLVLLLGVTGWCGGPPAADQGAASQSMGVPPGPVPTGQARPSPFVSVSGGYSPGSVDGSNASSPNMSLSQLGVVEDYAVSGRAMYAFDPVEFSLNWYLAMFSGENEYDQTIFSADGTVLANTGDTVSAEQHLNLLMFNGDVYAFDGPPWKAGVRLQYTQFADTFSIDNSTQGTSSSGAKDYSMFGIGAVGVFDLSAFNRLPHWCRTNVVKPRINIGATIGWDFGGEARYYAFDAFLQVFRKKMSYLSTCLTGAKRSGPALSGEVGWVYFEITETDEERVGPAPDDHSDVAHYYVSFPVFRLSLYF
jgi:hypothetical protein